MSSVNKFIEEHSESGIRTDFLTPNNYKTTLEFSQKRHQCYLKYCSLIKDYYNDFQSSARYLSEKIKIAPNDQLQSIKQFKQHLIDLVKAIEEVATFKIQFYNQLDQMELDPIRRPTDQIMYRVGKYSESQNKFAQIFQSLKASETSITNLYTQFKKDVKNPVFYFDQKFTKPKVQTIQGLLKSKEKLEEEGNSQLEVVYKNAVQFESDILNYRQRLVSSKYKTHKKISEMSKGARECLTQTLLTLFQIVYQREKAFQGLLRDSIRQSTLLVKYKRRGNVKGQENNDKLTQIIINATQQYNELINGVEGVIKNLMEGLLKMSQNCKARADEAKSLTEELNNLYDNDQNPTPEMLDTLDLFNYFCLRIGEIPNMLHLQLANLLKLKQNINKHSQITLSLIKCAVYKGKIESNNGPNSSNNKNVEQLNNLFDQLSYDYINDIMERVFKEIQTGLSKLKNYFNAKYHKKKKNHIQDSMDISHIQEQHLNPQKRPSKQQLWFWKEYKNTEKYKKIKHDVEQVKQITKFIQPFLQIKIDSQKEVEKFNCSLNMKKQTKGVLKILQKNILFSSSNNQIDINVPIQYVCQVVAKIKTFEKELSIITSIGQIIFSHFPQISKAEVLMQQQMNSNASSKQSTKKIAIEVSREEIDFIATRKSKIVPQLQSLDGYEQKGYILLQNTTVDAVYDLVYSDKPFKYKGKQQCCYFSYILKKSNGSNYSTTKFNPPGPKFYSLEEGRSFINTPLVSERTSQYDVPLPPIPFMPKVATNNQTIKLFWISHQEFDYLIRSQTRGAPSADCFFINIFHRVVKRQSNVEIKIYYKMNFVKDTALRGIISSKSSQQVKSKNQLFLTETSKILKIMGARLQNGKDSKKEDIVEQKEDEKSVINPKMQKLESQNKILIGVLVAIVVINLILRFLF